MFDIKEPTWGNDGCVAKEHIATPEGWLGYRKESYGFVITGIFNRQWRDDKTFKDVEDAKKYIVGLYREQVMKWLVMSPECAGNTQPSEGCKNSEVRV